VGADLGREAEAAGMASVAADLEVGAEAERAGSVAAAAGEAGVAAWAARAAWAEKVAALGALAVRAVQEGAAGQARTVVAMVEGAALVQAARRRQTGASQSQLAATGTAPAAPRPPTAVQESEDGLRR
jgi:hypothetical protein